MSRGRRRTLFLAAAVLAGLLSWPAWRATGETAHAAYLYALTFWVGLALGLLALGWIAELTGGHWRDAVRGPAVAAGGFLPLAGILFVPLLFGVDTLYPWASGQGAPAELLEHKAPYLDPLYFALRTLGYVVVWSLLAAAYRRRVRAVLRDGSAGDWQSLRRLAASGLVVYAISGSLAAVDWLMSLLPAWYSAVFGAQVLVGQLLAASAFAALMLPHDAPTRMRHDLGDLMLMFTLLWAYLAYSEFLTIWITDLPHETEWYRRRASDAWIVLAVALWTLQFVLPFGLLLFRSVKRHPAALRAVALLLLAGGLVNHFWMVVPSLRGDGELHWADAVLPLVFGGLWGLAYRWGGDEGASRRLTGERADATA